MKNIEFVSKEVVDKGWSSDKKYCATTSDGTKYLVRVNSKGKVDKLKKLYEISQEVEALGIPFCKAFEYGTNKDGEYIVQRWVNGEDAELLLPNLCVEEQYKHGLEAGQILSKIHSILPKSEQVNWDIKFNAKIDRKIKGYKECPVKLVGDKYILDYIEENRYLLSDRPITFQHGDYHIGNMMIENGKIVIIDFDRLDYGDPWEEFNRIVWCAQASPVFASGIVNGYFKNEVPFEFWKLLAIYICNNTISAIPWAVDFGENEINTMLKQGEEVLSWYSNMENVVPSWYIEVV